MPLSGIQCCIEEADWYGWPEPGHLQRPCRSVPGQIEGQRVTLQRREGGFLLHSALAADHGAA